MTIKEITKWEYICDLCNVNRIQDKDEWPHMWTLVTFSGKNILHLHICNICDEDFKSAVNKLTLTNYKRRFF